MAKEFVPLAEISNTDASLGEKESKAMIFGLLEGYFPTWKIFTTKKDPKINVYELAELFVNRHATLIGRDEPLYTSTPFHVARARTKEKVGEELVEVTTECIVYSNGAVILVRRPDELFTILLVDEKTMGHFDYPMPS